MCNMVCVCVCVLCGEQKEKNAPELDRQADELQKEALAVKIDEVRTCYCTTVLYTAG